MPLHLSAGLVLLLNGLLEAVEVLGKGRLLLEQLVDLCKVGELVEELPQELRTSKLLLAGQNLD